METSENTKYLFLFSLSPVQSFIAAARKTRDLYAGSQILSELTKTAATTAESKGIKLVFPVEVNPDPQVSFPNRFVGKIEHPQKDLSGIGKAIQNAVKTKFKDLATEALSHASLEKDIPEGFWSQICNHWDVNWLFYPYQGKYEDAYKMIEPLMEALKNQRTIKNDFVETGRKCSLDGQNNALFRGERTKNRLLKSQAVQITNAWIKETEGLSAISFVKRSYSEEKKEVRKFPSTIEVALKKQLEKRREDKSGLLEAYKGLFSKKYSKASLDLLSNGYVNTIDIANKKGDWLNNFNEEFYVEDNLTQKNIPNLTQLAIVKDVHQRHLKPFLKDRYYALIAFDGDEMGKLLSGETRKDKTKSLEAFQKNVSEKLMAFSKHIADTMNKQIDIVYSGGDDFMGFVNLNDLFPIVQRLREDFHDKVNKKLQKIYSLDNDFTFSMGITVAHYKTPLSIVLDTTRRMEKLAKDETKGDRNAFAISVLKHSGDNHEAYFKWDLENGFPAWNAFKALVQYLKEDCSETFIRVLISELYKLQNEKEEIEMKIYGKNGDNVASNIIKTEILRLTHRALKEGSKHKYKDLSNQVLRLFNIRDSLKEKTKVAADINNTLEALKIALFLNRETEKV